MLKRCCYCLLFLFLALGMGAGCAPYWYRSPEKFTVKNSRLNWVQIFYQASEDAPRVRCDMTNNGQIAILEGHSVTVGDDFNIEYDKKEFGDVRKYYYSMRPEMFDMTLQLLVDAGLLEREKPDEDAPLYPKVLVKANINHVKQDKFTYNELLISEIRTLLFQYKMSGTLSR
jgi:hypothetical protein